MDKNEVPTFAHGKICYLVIPALDVLESASFFEKTFGWHIRKQPDGSVSFDDSVNQVSGTWVTGLAPHTQFGISIHLMVFDIDKCLETVVQNGGQLIDPVDRDQPEITATISDPAGNIFGLYQHRG